MCSSPLASGVALVFALVTRVGAFTAVAGSIALMALLRLQEDALLERPWTLAVACAVLVVVSAALSAGTSERRWWARWDLPVAGVAHLTGVVAALLALDTGTVETTFAALGAIALAGAVRLRRQAWLAVAYACGSALLFLIAAAVAGPGWLALVLVALAAALSAAAVRVQGVGRWLLQWSGRWPGWPRGWRSPRTSSWTRNPSSTQRASVPARSSWRWPSCSACACWTARG